MRFLTKITLSNTTGPSRVQIPTDGRVIHVTKGPAPYVGAPPETITPIIVVVEGTSGSGWAERVVEVFPEWSGAIPDGFTHAGSVNDGDTSSRHVYVQDPE